MTNSVTFYIGDVFEMLQQIPDASVQCVVTSPPYWGLRDYQTATWEGGDQNCNHNPQRPDGGERATRTLPLGRGGMYRDVCGKCGAIRVDKQLGLESTPEEYVANLVSVFREVRRVLRDDGIVWLNLADSCGSGRGGGGNTRKQTTNTGSLFDSDLQGVVPPGLKPKDLVGIPWRTAFALQADGWYLRQDIIWHKTAPMPESVTDRCTKAHEYVFLLAKSQRYFYDADAIAEEQTSSTKKRAAYGWGGKIDDYSNGSRTGSTFRRMAETGEPIATIPTNGMRNRRSVWTVGPSPFSGAKLLADFIGADGEPYKASPDCPFHGHIAHEKGLAAQISNGSNCTCKVVETDHYATMPPELAKICILAGTSAIGQCPKCGAPLERVVEKTIASPGQQPGYTLGTKTRNGGERAGNFVDHKSNTVNWQPTCDCNTGDPVPQIVLDPFSGAGTTAIVALENGRHAIGIDLNPNYIKLAEARVASVLASPKLFYDVWVNV